MIDIKQLDGYIVSPTLVYLDMCSLSARRLMIGTALVESSLYYLKQTNGCAFGFWQVEPDTYHDNYDNYLNYHSRINLKKKFDYYRGSEHLVAFKMVGNLNYNCAHARLKYWRVPEALPHHDDFKGLAEYHKKYYNTNKGKTDVSKSVKLFEETKIIL